MPLFALLTPVGMEAVFVDLLAVASLTLSFRFTAVGHERLARAAASADQAFETHDSAQRIADGTLEVEILEFRLDRRPCLFKL